jgi:hypothetical protein
VAGCTASASGSVSETLMGQAKHVDGSMKSGIFGFRSLENCGRMAEYAHGKKRAAVIGGGLLGLECAHGLLSLGLEVHVMHRSSHLMNQQLDSCRRPRSFGRWWRKRTSACISRWTRPPSLLTNASADSNSRTARRTNASWWSSPLGSGPMPNSRPNAASPSSLRSWSTTRCAAMSTCTFMRSASV